MIDTAASQATPQSVETLLREELARGDAMADTVVPILRHLLANRDSSVFGDEIIARVRGMARNIAEQLLDALTHAAGEEARSDHGEDQIAQLVGAIVDNPVFLAHLHALALEWQLIEKLQSRLSLDPVLSPLLQALISSDEEETSALAMKLLASQARYCQAQRRMKLPLAELPGDLLHNALVAMRTLEGTEQEADKRAEDAESAIRRGYDEASSRLGLLARTVTAMGGGAIAALSVSHAGPAIFLSALAIGSGQDRDQAALSTSEAQIARLALALRSAGMKHAGVEEQMLILHPQLGLPEGFDRIDADRAAALLALGGGFPEG